MTQQEKQQRAAMAFGAIQAAEAIKPAMTFGLNVPDGIVEGIRHHWARACGYWLEDEPGIIEPTPEIVRLGVKRLLEMGGPVAATMVQDWIGDDDVYDAIVQLGALGHLRYG